MSAHLPNQSPPPEQSSLPDKKAAYGQITHRRRRKRFFGLFRRVRKPVESSFVAPKKPDAPVPGDTVAYGLPVHRRRRKRFFSLLLALRPPLGPSPGAAAFFSRRWRKFLKLFSPPKAPSGYYSPFLPLLIVFCSFILLLLYEISFLRYRTLVLAKQNGRFVLAIKKADQQTEFIDGLHKDLQALAPSHPAAASIVQDFFPETPTNTEGSSDPP